LAKYSVAIIGCGDIGFLFDCNKKTNGALTHFKAFNDSKFFEVKAVAEKKSSIRNLITKNFKIPAYEDYEKMLIENKFDVITIATNDDSHFEILKKIVAHKPGLVFCEKPLAINYEDANEIVSLYEKNKIHLQVNFTRRFMKEFMDIKKNIAGKKLGWVESVTFYYSRGLTHNASHYLDLINWYIGETEKNIVKISEKEGLGGDDTVSFNLMYPGGTEVRFIGLSPSKISFSEIDIVGTKGRIRVNYNYEIEKYKVVKNKTYSGYEMYEKYDSRLIKFASALPNAIENIYKALEKKENLRVPASDSLKIFELIKRIKETPLCQS